MKAVQMLFIVVFNVIFVIGVGRSYAHCEIPCGIYNDSLRITLIGEHISTIEKSMNMIVKLSKSQNIDHNQLVRWIDNKEEHAKKTQEIITQYFMHQRIKPVGMEKKKKYEKYVKEITLLHRMLVYAMNCKQTTDSKNIGKLRTLLSEFTASYFAKKQ